MGITADLERFADRHPFVQDALKMLSPAHLTTADRVATKFEDVAKTLAVFLPDGEALTLGLTFLQRAQQTVLSALAELEGGTLGPVVTPAPAPVAIVRTAPNTYTAMMPGRDHPITGPVPTAAMPGRDMPVTSAAPVAPVDELVAPVVTPEDTTAPAVAAVDGSTDATPAATTPDALAAAVAFIKAAGGTVTLIRADPDAAGDIDLGDAPAGSTIDATPASV